MSSGPSHNAELKEKLELLLNEGLVRKDTLASRAASAIAQENQGRFAKGTTITGSQAATQYPRIASGPWSDNDGTGVEPPLGYDVNEPVVVGETWEIERSLQSIPCCIDAEGSGEQNDTVSSLPNSLGEVAPAALASTASADAAVETLRAPTFRKRKIT